jgi:hypothetical protein
MSPWNAVSGQLALQQVRIGFGYLLQYEAPDLHAAVSLLKSHP